MKLYEKGSGKVVDITDQDFVTSGGEGKIYLKHGLAYKIYHDPSKMIPVGKIDELRKLDQDNIIKPLNVLCDKSGAPLGYSMKALTDAIAICKLSTNSFRKKFSVTQDMTAKLIERIAKDTSYIHKQGKYLIVDGNIMNYHVDSKFTIPYFIDVDSYQTPSFPASAIMASVRDYHTKGEFSELTDWFTFAVLAAELFVGIHPYKGTHDDFESLPKEERIVARMKANVSIFNKKVSLPSAARDLDSIPANYKEWLFRVLEKGERILPPGTAGAIIAMAPRIISIVASNQFTLELIKEYSSEVIRYVNGYVTIQDRIISPDKSQCISARRGVEVISSPIRNEPIKVYIEHHALMLEPLNVTKGAFTHHLVSATDKMVFNNSVFIRHENKVLEIVVNDIGQNTVTSVSSSWNVLTNATKLFNGLVYQNVLGVPYFMLFYKLQNGKTACSQFPVKELQGYDVLEAKYENRIACIVAAKSGQVDTFIFKLAEDLATYKLALESDTGIHIPNFIVLDNGICVRITINDEVQIFSNRLDKTDVKIIKDPAVTFDMSLAKTESGKVAIVQGKKIYKLGMK